MSDTPTNCPHCGAENRKTYSADDRHPEYHLWACGTTGTTKEGTRSDLCRERAARQKAKAEVNDARANADSWRVQSDRLESQLLETSNQLAETRKELAEAHKHLNDYRAICLKQHSATVAAKDAEKELAKTKRELMYMTSEADRDHDRWKRAADDLAKERAAHAETKQHLETLRAELAEAVRCLDAACVVQTNATDRRQWVTYSGWLSPGDSLCEVALPPKNTEAKEGS